MSRLFESERGVLFFHGPQFLLQFPYNDYTSYVFYNTIMARAKLTSPRFFHWHWLAWINVWSVVKYDQVTFFTFKQINTIFLPCVHIGWCKYLRCFRDNYALSKNELAVVFESSFIAQAVTKIKDFTSFSCYTPPSSFTFSFFQAWCMDVIIIMRNSRPCCVWFWAHIVVLKFFSFNYEIILSKLIRIY